MIFLLNLWRLFCYNLSRTVLHLRIQLDLEINSLPIGLDDSGSNVLVGVASVLKIIKSIVTFKSLRFSSKISSKLNQ